jgi:hypothetical protein
LIPAGRQPEISGPSAGPARAAGSWSLIACQYPDPLGMLAAWT